MCANRKHAGGAGERETLRAATDALMPAVNLVFFTAVGSSVRFDRVFADTNACLAAIALFAARLFALFHAAATARDALRRIAKTQREPCQIWRDTYPYLVRRTPNFRAPSDADRRERPIPHIRRPKRPLASRRTPNFVRSPSDPHHATQNHARARCRMPKFPYEGNTEKQTQKRVSAKPAFLYTILFW